MGEKKNNRPAKPSVATELSLCGIVCSGLAVPRILKAREMLCVYKHHVVVKARARAGTENGAGAITPRVAG